MADHSTVITDNSQLVDWVATGAKPKPDWRIGTEHEKILFHRGDFSPVAYEGADGVGAMLGALCTHIGDKARPIMEKGHICLLYTSPSPRDATLSRMPSSA